MTFDHLFHTVPMDITTLLGPNGSWTVTLETPAGKVHLTGTAALPLLELRHEIDTLIRALGYESEIAA